MGSIWVEPWRMSGSACKQGGGASGYGGARRLGFLVEDRRREEVSELREREADRLAGLIAGGEGRRMAVRGELRARAVMAEAVVFWASGAGSK